MHIILVSDRLARARSIEVSLKHLALALSAGMLSVLTLSTAISYFSVRHASEIKLPFLQSMLRAAYFEDLERTETFVRENVNVMAVKLGEMQAQLLRLDALGERLSKAAGLRPGEFRFGEIPGRGGLAPGGAGAPSLSLDEFGRQLESVAREVESRDDYLGLLESRLLDSRVRQTFAPTALPVLGSWNASGFGWRLDPITGQMAMHEGIDFIAETGTPIHAAAAGVVVTAEFHPAYGNMVEIDHGGDLVTRYAHCSKVLVKPGQVVKRGDKIAEVGSTGRSTGPHLHFEVRLKGVAQNPARFLLGGSPAVASSR
jgi:murein DD-endopeptidase MepM/ murein hydrolase activator NlpD